MTAKKPQLKKSPYEPTDFYCFMGAGDKPYIYKPTGKMWPTENVRKQLGSAAADKIHRERSVAEITWEPGLPAIIQNKLAVEGGWLDKPGANTFNFYKPPKPIAGDASKIAPWLKHGEKLWGDQLEHIVQWFAWRVQHPENKINHGLTIGSPRQGIGKDMFQLPLMRAVGPWNYRNISAGRAYTDAGDKNSFLQSVVLVINEVHDLGDKRFGFYDRTKDWMAAPPLTLQISDKWIVQHPIANLVGVIKTTNHKTNGLYIPPDDRREYVAWSDVVPEDFEPDYFARLAQWYKDGGIENVARYLATLKLTMDPKAPPPKTAAWWSIVNAGMNPEDGALKDVLDYMGEMADDITEWGEWPHAATLETIRRAADAAQVFDITSMIDRDKGNRAVPHKLELAGYEPMKNDADRRDGQWRVGGKRATVYVRRSLAKADKISAVHRLIERERPRASPASKNRGLNTSDKQL